MPDISLPAESYYRMTMDLGTESSTSTDQSSLSMSRCCLNASVAVPSLTSNSTTYLIYIMAREASRFLELRARKVWYPCPLLNE